MSESSCISKLCPRSPRLLPCSSPGVGVVGLVAPCCSSSFFMRLSLARRFWNQTWITRMSNPVSWESCSRTCLEGLGLMLYAVLRISSCLAVMVVRGLFWLPSVNKDSQYSKIPLLEVYVSLVLHNSTSCILYLYN